jgi:hypothetical protein
MDREIFHIESVNVPFPDESPDQYRIDFAINFQRWIETWDNFVLIEAGIIRGGNYTWIATEIKDIAPHKSFYTVALCENISSKYKSDLVSLYYDDNIEDLHFWWENPNNHWL